MGKDLRRKKESNQLLSRRMTIRHVCLSQTESPRWYSVSSDKSTKAIQVSNTFFKHMPYPLYDTYIRTRALVAPRIRRGTQIDR